MLFVCENCYHFTEQPFHGLFYQYLVDTTDPINNKLCLCAWLTICTCGNGVKKQISLPSGIHDLKMYENLWPGENLL